MLSLRCIFRNIFETPGWPMTIQLICVAEHKTAASPDTRQRQTEKRELSTQTCTPQLTAWELASTLIKISRTKIKLPLTQGIPGKEVSLNIILGGQPMRGKDSYPPDHCILPQHASLSGQDRTLSPPLLSNVGTGWDGSRTQKITLSGESWSNYNEHMLNKIKTLVYKNYLITISHKSSNRTQKRVTMKPLHPLVATNINRTGLFLQAN